MKRIVLTVVLAVLFKCLFAQGLTLYVAAKSGLSLRAQPSVNSQVISKLLYGEKIFVKEYMLDSGVFKIEGFESEWIKVSIGGKTGYVASAFLFSIPPPTNNVKTLKGYLDQLFKVACTVEYGERSANAEENYDARSKFLYKNGGEVHYEQGYEWGSTAYVLPGFNIQSAFHLLRLVPEFSRFINQASVFPGKDQKAGGVETKVYTEDDCTGGFKHCIRKIKFYSENETIEELEIIELNGEVYIDYENGV